MYLIFKSKAGVPDIEVRFTPVPNLSERLKEYLNSATNPTIHDIYARATFIKYGALVREFARVANTFDEWRESRANQTECFVLLEAIMPAQNQTAGSLVIRSAWNNDLVFDLLVTNVRAQPKVNGVGIMLVLAAGEIARQSGAEFGHVETAAGTTTYWVKFFRRGGPFIRHDTMPLAFRRAKGILADGGVTYVQNNEKS
jgi:hypothetical protein